MLISTLIASFMHLAFATIGSSPIANVPGLEVRLPILADHWLANDKSIDLKRKKMID